METAALLPMERAALIVNGVKATGDATELVRHMLGREAAKQFFLQPVRKVARINIGGLGWSEHRFNLVDWEGLRDGLKGRPAMFGVWLAKQSIGVCATQWNMAPNCHSYREDSAHLNRCMEAGRTLLFKDSIQRLGMWMEATGCTDSTLGYWIQKFLLTRGRRPCRTLKIMPTTIAAVAADINTIGWTEFLHGRIPCSITKWQTAHCIGLVQSRLTGRDWVKGFIRQLLRISHSQWIYRNFTLHHKTRGYLALKKKAEVLSAIANLTEQRPEDLPEDSRFLLEMDFESLVLASSYGRQAYWVLAMKAALRGGKLCSSHTWKRTSRDGTRASRLVRLATVEYVRVARIDGVAIRSGKRKPWGKGGSTLGNGSNKRLRKPD